MTWKWWRRMRRKPKCSIESEIAFRQGERALVDAERRDEAAQAIVEQLRETRVRNHFAEAIARSMRRT